MKRSVKRHLKLIAVVTVVTLALSGFSQARSGGGKGGGGRGSSSKSGGGGGGGCGKDKAGSRSSYSGYRGTTAGSGSSGSSGSSSRKDEPDAEIISCAKGRKGTVVELSDGDAGTYTVRVYLVDDFGDAIDTSSQRVSVGRNQTKRVEVKPRDPSMVGAADDCSVYVTD
ncbi:hypothetical protein [Streptomyces barkulensis]|uniref:hypothetical protein n=1 Tax=Streptomyces barkulensis TaxID=1257026 RepID=UPI0013043E3C|nr:hypothetical protein [Streptomyces barkulensis]